MFGVGRSQPVFDGLLDRSLHGIEIDLAVALNVNIFIQGKLRYLGVAC